MADIENHRAALEDLNRNYVRSVDEADVAWFDANLAVDFFNTNPDGSLLERKAFFSQIGSGSSVKNISSWRSRDNPRAHEVPEARRYTRRRRYTDIWQFREGRWQCVAAHVTRL